MSQDVEKWMTAYRAAWESNDPSDIGALFTADAVYYNEPFSEPARGRDAIVARWIARKDEPGTTTFTWKQVSKDDDPAFVQGETDYGSAKYSNLWVIRFAPSAQSNAPEATEFTEWWMDHANPSGE
jgi:ketosteroid isomerase-like protein